MKYNEEEINKQVLEYISSTYNGHYTNDENNIQTIDLIRSIGDGEPFCRSSALKYLSRLGKKQTATPRSDLLKAIHFCYLLYHFSGCDKPSTENYSTLP